MILDKKEIELYFLTTYNLIVILIIPIAYYYILTTTNNIILSIIHLIMDVTLTIYVIKQINKNINKIIEIKIKRM